MMPRIRIEASVHTRIHAATVIRICQPEDDEQPIQQDRAEQKGHGQVVQRKGFVQ